MSPNVFYQEIDVKQTASGGTSNWHGWGSVSWSVSIGNSISIVANGSSTEGNNGALCSGGAGWVYGQGHGEVSITFVLDSSYSYFNTSSSGVTIQNRGTGTTMPLGASGPLSIGVYTITGSCRGVDSFSVDVSMVRTGTPIASNKIHVIGDVTCPPQDANLQFNVDHDGDCVLDSWDTEHSCFFTMSEAYPLTDEAGTELFSVCLPGACGLSQSYRIRRAGELSSQNKPGPGKEVGKCLYPEAKNYWDVTFVDADGDNVPDRFLKSTFSNTETVNGVPTGNQRVFVADFTTDLITYVETGPGALIADTRVARLGIDLCEWVVKLSAQPGDQQDLMYRPSPFVASLTPSTSTAVPGDLVAASGEIENTTSSTVQYQLTFSAENVTLNSSPSTLTVGPGASATYSVDGTVGTKDHAAISVVVCDPSGECRVDSAAFRYSPKRSRERRSPYSLVAVSIPEDSMNAGCHPLWDDVWSVSIPPLPLNLGSGIGNLLRGNWVPGPGDFCLHDHVYLQPNEPDPTRAEITFEFDSPTVVGQVEVVQHANGITQIEVLAGNSLGRLTSLGTVFGPLGDVTGSSVFPEGSSYVFDVQSPIPGRFFRVVIKKTSLSNGWASYRIFPRSPAGVRYEAAR